MARGALGAVWGALNPFWGVCDVDIFSGKTFGRFGCCQFAARYA